MSRRRVIVVLAIMAALAGAPSSVSAASPNELSEASVAPSSGETSTLFVISVRYVSTAGNPAAVVTADVGGQVAVLALVAGTATDGVWRGVTSLPPGSWEVTVQASVVSGPAPSLSAGTVTVGIATNPPSPPQDEAPSFGPGPGPGGGATSSPPAAQPVPTPPAPAAASPAPARSSTKAAPSQPPTGPAPGGATPARSGGSGEAHTRSPRVAKPSGGSGAAHRSPAPSSTTGVSPEPGVDDGGLGLFMLMGSLAVGMVALVGSAWVVLAGRRDRRATLTAGSGGADPGVTAAAMVDQRALRRARLRSSDDPILAAMGLPDDHPTPSADAAPAPRHRSPRSRGRRGRPAR
jgi:hypothetical protein